MRNLNCFLRHVGCAMAAVTAIGVAEAQPQGRLGSIVICNPTNSTLTYQFRWGNGSWKRYRIPPGRWNTHSHVLDRNNRAPFRWVRFDHVGGDDRVTVREYRLDFYQVREDARGKPYFFQYYGNGKLLDLYRPTREDERAFHDSLTYRDGNFSAVLPKSWKGRRSGPGVR